jgi:hypothetical protein
LQQQLPDEFLDDFSVMLTARCRRESEKPMYIADKQHAVLNVSA